MNEQQEQQAAADAAAQQQAAVDMAALQQQMQAILTQTNKASNSRSLFLENFIFSLELLEPF